MHKIQELIQKYNSGQCTTEEKLLLEQWYQLFDWNNKNISIPEGNMEDLKKEVWCALQKNTIPASRKHHLPSSSEPAALLKWWHYGSAAAIITTILILGLFRSQPKKAIISANRIEKTAEVNKVILPGTSKAQLLLANGSILSLDSARSMQLKEEDGTRINKQAGKLIYTDGTSGNGKVLFNTLSTPRGGEYQLGLPDGSKVWLNAASSIKFPTHFEGKQRTVFLHGEAYFEVAKIKGMPFQVKLDNDMVVEVVGTHFNIMGYNDEREIKTTLEEGIVKVTNQNKTVLLSPSQQAIIKRNYQGLTISDADVAKALAWKNGMIEFDGDDLPYIMRQLSRWYDVDISFTNDIPKGTYKGAIRRQSPLSNILEILKLAGVKFKIEEKKLTVTGG
ncbi:MAG: FecR family protein [Ferruginibacter sp.]|nr:FecR family protein [Ferruginibacter sp.]